MNKIDTTYWKEFRVGLLFPDIKKPKVYHTREVVEDNSGIPYVVRSKFNNGIKCRIKPEGLEHSPKGVITFGAENAAFFYQSEEWCGGRDIYYIDTRNLNPYACLFLAACLNQITDKYNYSFGLFPDLLKKEKIRLPAKDDAPDWQYMEDYMQQIELRTKKALSSITSSKNNTNRIDIIYWKEFIIEKIFSISRPEARLATDYDAGNVPFVASGNVNNGVEKYVNAKGGKLDDKGCISVSPVDGSSFYQPIDFLGRGGAGSSIILLRNEKLRPHSAFFICSILRKVFSKYNYSNMGSASKIKKEKIFLPTTPSGEPDWRYMEMYMRGVEAIAKNKLSLLAPRKPEVTIKEAETVTFTNANVTYIDKSTNYNIKK